MNSKDLLAEYSKTNADHVSRLKAAIEGKSDDDLNRRANGEWSPYQIIDHLILSHDLYLRNMSQALAGTPGKGDELSETRNTFLGKMIRKAAGPNGNAPAPKAFVPASGPFAKETVDRWVKLQADLQGLAKDAGGRDLSSLRIPNPIVKVFKMNFVDCFQILSDHTERHIRQIEERVQA